MIKENNILVENHGFEEELNLIDQRIDVNNLKYNLLLLDRFALNANPIDKSWADFQQRISPKENDTLTKIFLKVG